jgi:tetratricopeptide (TPR) repeat protein
MAETTHRSLVGVHALIDDGRYEDAAGRLDALKERTRGRPYDQAIVAQTSGHVHHALGESDAAIASFERALELEVLPDAADREVRYNLAVLLVEQGRYRQGLETLDTLLRKGTDANAETCYLASVAHYHLGECDAAISWIERALALSSGAPRDWRELLVTCLLERARFNEAVPVLQDLIRQYPGSGRYWQQLSFVHQASDRDAEAIAVLALAHRQGLLDEEAIQRLASLYLQEAMPWRAAKLLEGAIARGELAQSARNWGLLADGLIAADEPAEAVPVLRRAAETGNAGESWFRLGSLLFRLQRWKESIDALDHALAEGGPEDIGNAYLMLGVAATRAGDMERAQTALRLALDDPASAKPAGRWLDWLAHQSPDQG